MEMNTKTKMWLDAQEHPEQFTDDELRQLMADPEVRALMEATALGKRALMKQMMDRQSLHSAPNSLKSKAISPKSKVIRPKSKVISLKSKVNPLKSQKLAASFVGLLLVSGIALASLRFVQSDESKTAEVETPATAVGTTVAAPAVLPADTVAEASPVVFDNVTLDSILLQIAGHYGYGLAFRSDQPKGLRLFLTWNPEDSIQHVTDKLNLFEQIHIVLDRQTIIVE